MAERDLTVRIDGNSQGLTTAAAQAEHSMSGVGDGKSTGWTGKISTAFTAMAAGAVAAAGVIAVSFGKDAWAAATDATDARANLQRTFGALSDEFVEKGKQAAEKFAIPAREYEKNVAMLGQSLMGLGFTTQDAATQMDPLIQRLSDVAARAGVDLPVAMEAFGSLLRNERDPIEQFGVAIKQSDVNARLAALGLDNLTGEALKNAEAQVSLQLFMEKTNTSMGAQAERAETAAGKMAILNARYEDIKSTVGQLFQSGVVGLFDWIAAGGERLGQVLVNNHRWFITLGSMMADIWNAQLGLMNQIISKLSWLGQAMWNATVWPLQKANELWDKLFSKGTGGAGGILGLGGKSAGPSSSPAAVVPLGPTTTAATSTAAPTYNINVTAGVGDPAEIGRKVIDAIRSAERVQGTGWRAA